VFTPGWRSEHEIACTDIYLTPRTSHHAREREGRREPVAPPQAPPLLGANGICGPSMSPGIAAARARTASAGHRCRPGSICGPLMSCKSAT